MAERTPDKSSHFDADAIAAAQESPTLTVGDYLYRGRLLSIEEWLPWWERLLAMQREHVDDRAPAADRIRKLTAFYRDYLRVVFPRRRYRWWAPDPVKHLMAQPFVVVEEAIASFFFLQARATFGEKADDAMKTRLAQPGPNSPPEIISEPGGP